MPGASDWQNLPNSLVNSIQNQQSADQWTQDQQAQVAQDWGDAQRSVPPPAPPPTRDDWSTNLPLAPSAPASAGGSAPATPPAPAAGAASPLSPGPGVNPPAPVAPAASTPTAADASGAPSADTVSAPQDPLAASMAGQGDNTGVIAAGSPSASGASQPGASTPQGDVVPAYQGGRDAFVKSFQPYADYAGRVLGIDPSIVTAMAISESGGGNVPGNSFFGMKGSPYANGSVSMPTWELVNGQRVNISANFATFADPKAAVDAWIDYIQKNDPHVVGAKTPEEFAAALKAGGYMTDTWQHYAQTLRGLGAREGGGDPQPDAFSPGQSSAPSTDQSTNPSTSPSTDNTPAAPQDPLAAAQSAVGGFFSNVGSTAQNAVQAAQGAAQGAVNQVTSMGQTNTPGPPIQGPYTSLLPGGTQNPVAGEQDAAKQILGPLTSGGVLANMQAAADLAAKYPMLDRNGNPLPGIPNLDAMPQDAKDHYAQAMIGVVASTLGSGDSGNTGGKPLFGRGGVPGADVGRNPVPAPTQPQDLTNALQQSQYQVVINQIRQAGWSDDQIAASLKSQGIDDDTIQNLLNPAPAPTVPPTRDDWQTQLNNVKQSPDYQNATPAQQTQMVADAQGQFANETPAVQPDAGGTAPPSQVPPAPPAGSDATPPPTGPTEPPPLNQLTQAQPLPKPSGVSAVLSSAFQPIANMPPDVQTALKQYAAVVGPDSNAATVEAQQTARGAAQVGTEVDQGAVRSAVASDAKSTLMQQLTSLGVANDPQVQSVISNIEDSGQIASNPLGRALLQAQSEIKGVIFPLSMFHAYTEGLNAAFSQPDGAAQFAKAFFSQSPTAAMQDSPMWLRAAKAGVTGLQDLNAPDAPSTLTGVQGAAVRSGIGAVGGAGAGYAGTKIAGGSDDQARQNAMVAGLAGAIGAPLAKPLISDNLWRAVQFSKVKVFEGLVNSGVDDQVASDAVNRQFGGLNYAQMGRDRDLQNVLRLTVQAPDWNEATARQLGNTFFGSGSGASFSRGVVARTVAATALTTEVLNYAFTGHSSFQNAAGHQAQVQLPGGTANKPVYIGIGPGNLQAYADLVSKIASNPGNTLQSTYYSRGQQQHDSGYIPQFILNRAGTIPSDALAALTGGQTAYGGSKAPLPAQLASPLAPISISNFTDAQQNGMSPATAAFLTALGLNPRYGSTSTVPAAIPIRPTQVQQRKTAVQQRKP